jgi:mannose-P-dolichol utilization defect protein 1
MPSTKALIALPKWLLDIAEPILGPGCTKALLREWNFRNTDCLRLALSKGLSLGIIGGSMAVKMPQIGKVLLSRSTEGLSFLAYILETISTSINFAYNLRAGNPFTTYGETLFISLQNVLMVGLLGIYRQQPMQLLLLMAVYSVFMSSLLLPDIYPWDGVWLSYLQAATIPIAAFSRLPQIYKVWCTGHTGQLSAATVFAVALGSLARLYTTRQEVGGDRLLLISFGSAALLNTVIALQMLWYWNSRPKPTGKSPSKKKQA